MILLHIGSPKAGSTTIQHYLGRAGPDETGAEQLQAFGIGNAWRLAAAADTPATFRYWVERHALMTPQEHARNQGDIWDRARAEVAGRSGRTFLASSEYMYSLWGSDAAALRGMRTALEEIFGAVRILVYLREQVGFLKSNYAQLVTGRSRSTLSYDAYVAGLEERRGFWDYWGTLSVWAEVFGEDAMEVVVFDPRAFEGGDLLADFRHRIGAPAPAGPVAAAGGAANRSPGYDRLRVLRHLNRLAGLPPAGLPHRILRRALLSLPVNLGTAAFPDRHDRHILQMVADGNARLNARFLSGAAVQLPVVS